MSASNSDEYPPLMGWREWITLPELGIDAIKVKVDTGARSSAIHAFDIERFDSRGRPMVRFKVHPTQRNSKRTVICEAEVVDMRSVRSSSGKEQLRFFIETEVEYRGQRWPIELTLARRDQMGFRMLLGRQAVRGRYAVDPARSYVGAKASGIAKAKAKRSRQVRKPKDPS